MIEFLYPVQVYFIFSKRAKTIFEKLPWKTWP
jgi:hypothetical protein